MRLFALRPPMPRALRPPMPCALRPAAAVLLAALAAAAAPARAQVTFGGTSTFTPITIEFIDSTLAPATSYDFGVGLRQNVGATLVRLDQTPVRLNGLGGRLWLRVPLGTVTLSAPHTQIAATDTFTVTGPFACSSSITGGTVALTGSGDQAVSGSGTCALPEVRVRIAGGDAVLSGTVSVTDSLLLETGGVRLGGGTLTLAQSLLQGTVTGPGALRATGGSPQTLGGTLTGLSRLVVDKAGFALTLASDFALTDSLLLVAGDLDLGGRTVDLGATGGVRESGGRAYGLGRLVSERALTAPDEVNPGNLGFEITSGANLGLTRVSRSHAVQTDGSNTSIARYFDVTAATNTGLDALVRVFYHEAELNGHPETTLKLFRSTDAGASWADAGGTVSPTRNRVTLSGVGAFSRWTLAPGGSLPVELVAFTAQGDADGVRLAWTTASETDNAGWHVESRLMDTRAVDGGASWQALAFVPGRGTTAETQTYGHHARGLAPGRHAFRLRQTDLDGASTVTEEVEVAVAPGDALVLTGPNPVRGTAALRLAVREAQTVRADLYDATGRHVARLLDARLDAGAVRTLTVDGDALAPGAYFVRIDGERATLTRPLAVVR